jgi:acyl-CoA dehydrogenase
MRDVGVVTRGMHDGREILGIKLTWDKRYITLPAFRALKGAMPTISDTEREAL